jgi:hypothetical protein
MIGRVVCFAYTQALRGVELRTPDFKYPAGLWPEKQRAPPVPVLKQLTLAIQDVQVCIH